MIKLVTSTKTENSDNNASFSSIEKIHYSAPSASNRIIQPTHSLKHNQTETSLARILNRARETKW